MNVTPISVQIIMEQSKLAKREPTFIESGVSGSIAANPAGRHPDSTPINR